MTPGVKSLVIKELQIPFRLSFKHHSAERSTTQSVVVIAGDGTNTGYGESCPREYVTNESIRSVLSFFELTSSELVEKTQDLRGLKTYLERNENKISENPSAWCAIELALLDLFSKQQRCSIEKLLNIPELTGVFQYTAVIGDGSFESFSNMAGQYVKLKFSDFKIKISGDPAQDYRKLIFLNDLTRGKSRIRLDANNLWDKMADVVSFLEHCPVPIFAVEEPLKSRSIPHLKDLYSRINTPLILDESFNNARQLEQLKELPGTFIINLRVSKMGGILRSLDVARGARQLGIGLIIGAQVGETSILTRAGLCVANSIRPYQIAMEGAFGTQLLEHDIVNTPLMFGPAGELRPETLIDNKQYGFQLAVKEDSISG